MGKFKFVLFTLLTLLFVVSMMVIFPLKAQASPGDTGEAGGFTWRELSDGTVEITGYSGPADVVIPLTLSDKIVSAIGNGAFQSSSITSVTINADITRIGDYAFDTCNSLVSINDTAGVVIPSGVTSIGHYAFNHCVLISSVVMPDSVTSIGNDAFANCSALNSVTLSNTLGSVSGGAFEYCSSLASVSIPASVTSIGDSAFTDCTSLTNLTISEGSVITSIGNYAFNGCTSLSDVTLRGSSMASVGNNAFSSCTALTEIVIPDSVTSIGEFAFYCCTGLATIDMPDQLSALGQYAFGSTHITSLTIPAGLTVIPDYAFAWDYYLTSVTIPGTVQTIGDSAFYLDSGLTSVTLCEGVRHLGSRAFAYTQLAELTIPSSAEDVGVEAFSYCTLLTRATFLGMATTIDISSFYYSSLADIYGFPGSAAETYATTNYYNFHALYTVTFNSMGGPAVPSVYDEFGHQISEPAAPARTGYYLEGWYTSALHDTKVAFPYTVPGEATLYANWILEQYDIKAESSNTAYGYVTGGGTYFYSQVAVLNAVPYAGYRFAGWMEGGSIVYSEAEYHIDATENRDLVAVFEITDTPILSSPVSAGYNRLSLSWTPVTGASGYDIWRCSTASGTYTKRSTETGTTYTDSGLTVGRTYYYKVGARFTAGLVTTYGPLSAYRSGRPVPAAPTGVTAEKYNYNTIRVTWNPVAGSSGYYIYRSLAETGTYTKVGSVSSAVYRYKNTYLKTGTTYYYKVRAYKYSGSTRVTGGLSVSVNATPLLNEMSGVSAATYYPTAIKIRWTAVPGRTSYEVWRSLTGTEGSYVKRKTTPYTYYKDTGLTIDSTYYYKVKAYRLVGTHREENAFSTAVSDTARVFAVSNVKAAMYSVTSNKITWKSVPGASGYEVSQFDAEGHLISALTPTTAYTYYYDRSIVAGSTYYYKVRAFRMAGTVKKYGDYCADIVTCYSKPANPKAVMYTVNSNKITWSAVPYRTSYEVYSSDSLDGTYEKITPATYTYNYFYHRNIDKNKTYFYKIRAVQVVGTETKYSGYSDTVSVVNKVIGASARVYSATAARISWGAVPGRTAYELFRCDAGGTIEATPLKTTGYTYFIDYGRTPNTTYYYRVRAYQNIGGTRYESNLSDIVYVTPTLKAPKGVRAARYSSTKIKLTWYAVSGATGYEILRSDTEDGVYAPVGKVLRTYFTNSGLISGHTYYYKIRAYKVISTITYPGNLSLAVHSTV